MFRSCSVFLIAIALSGPAWAQAECDSALVKATYKSFASDHTDSRLASEVTENTWNEISHNAGAHATIYGVPVGATWSDFTKRVSAMMKSEKHSLTHDQARNVMWTGLDPNGSNDYLACLNAGVLRSRGLHLVTKWATENDIAILARWVPQGADPATIDLTWSRPRLGSVTLPTKLTAGEQVIVVPRPDSN